MFCSGRVGIAIDYKKTEAEQGMLMNLHKRGWTEGLKLQEFDEMKHSNEEAIKVSLYS
jgi:26S proteasome regulatory subunit N11